MNANDLYNSIQSYILPLGWLFLTGLLAITALLYSRMLDRKIDRLESAEKHLKELRDEIRDLRKGDND